MINTIVSKYSSICVISYNESLANINLSFEKMLTSFLIVLIKLFLYTTVSRYYMTIILKHRNQEGKGGLLDFRSTEKYQELSKPLENHRAKRSFFSSKLSATKKLSFLFTWDMINSAPASFGDELQNS
jgi:hypothetical protein